MRILLINPNTTPEITELVAGHARTIAGQGVEIVPATGRFGARYISTRAAARPCTTPWRRWAARYG